MSGENPPDVIWAAGVGFGAKTHIYLNEKDFLEGKCLCGRKVNPVTRYTRWDLNSEIVKEHTCRECEERMKLIKFL